MRDTMHRVLAILVLGTLLALAQRPHPPELDSDVRLPNGKMQKDEILKADHEKSLKDASDLVKAAEDFKAELEKNDRYVLSVTSLKQLDEIEKLAKRLRSRLKH